MKKFIHIASIVLFLVGIGVVVPVAIVTKGNVKDATIQKTMMKYGCKPTNEFVGKNAERLYLCADGLKQKYDTIRAWAYQEKKSWND